MLQIKKIDITNFVCFDQVSIDFSTASDKRLTVIRAENGSGKTTFLRAFRWAMYGAKGLPGDPHKFSIHPPSWIPDSGGLETSVSIEFETDGSTRFDEERATRVQRYLLRRSVTTYSQDSIRGTEPDFIRSQERRALFVAHNGEWIEHELEAEKILDVLLPWELRDFFVMDADEAIDFVGGSEGSEVSKDDMTEKTTGAINSLLGLNVFRLASDRLATLEKTFRKQATDLIGNSELSDLQHELDVREDRLKAVRNSLTGANESLQRHEERFEKSQQRMEMLMRDSGALEQLQLRRKANSENLEICQREHTNQVKELSRLLESDTLLSRLMLPVISDVALTLQPLYDAGHIPLQHLSFVRELLESGECICGERLEHGCQARSNVESRLRKSQEDEARANYLGHLYNASREFENLARHNDWHDQVKSHQSKILELEKKLSSLEAESQEIEGLISKVDEEEIRELQKDQKLISDRISSLRIEIHSITMEIDSLNTEIDGYRKAIDAHQKTVREANAVTQNMGLTEAARVVIDNAYQTIQDAQVHELSVRMNKCFQRIVANIDDSELDFNADGVLINPRMIKKVGVQEARNQDGKFEIFALNDRDRLMPPTEINGASRRVLALAFVLALCIESRTDAPLIADSLLNSMSGSVRRNTLRTICEESGQPILLLTPADLDGEEEVRLVEEFAAHVYTLTGQWDARPNGDVINRTREELVSLLCTCGPRDFCSICEREGWRQKTGWSERV